MNEFFDLVRPLIEFRYEAILVRSNNIFELMTVEPIDILLKGELTPSKAEKKEEEEGLEDAPLMLGEEEDDQSLHLKGQMMFMAEWNVIMFLSSPSFRNFEALTSSGLFINDLSMHDFSRDLILAGTT